ncbi:MAG: TIGR02300 family protein [Xanthobacteraceae bacterium]
MAKPELGTKRVCPVTGRKFYDLNKDPVISPYTGQVVPIETVVTRGRPEPARAAAVPEEVEAPEVQEAEFVSLEEADAEAQGGSAKVPAGEADEEVEVEDEALDDAAFIVPEEEEDEDVADIIGGDIEDEEES